MSFVAAALIGAGGAIVGGGLAASASSKAGKMQADAANRAADLQYQQFKETQGLYEPWRTAGTQALNKLVGMSDYTPFGMDQFQTDPGYAFRLSEGQKALERSAAARGGLISGATGKALTRYGQEVGSQEYQNAFNRYQAERAAKLQPLQALAGIGQSSTNQVAAAGQNYANQVGDMTTSGAAARASGYVGSANALSNALSNVGNTYMQSQMLNKLMTTPRYTYPSYATLSYNPANALGLD